MRQILNELGISGLDQPIPVFEDNQAVIRALKVWDMKRLKHIDIKYNFVKALLMKNVINVTYQRTGDQVADMMTKGLSLELFSKHRKGLGMTEVV